MSNIFPDPSSSSSANHIFSITVPIALDKTVERLSRNLMSFDGEKELIENYFDFESVKKRFDESTVLIIDNGDGFKPHSTKIEGIWRIRDASTGEHEVVEASKPLYGLAKFTFYAILDGICEIFTNSMQLSNFFVRPEPSPQLLLPGMT